MTTDSTMKKTFALFLQLLLSLMVFLFITEYWVTPNYYAEVNYGELKGVLREKAGWTGAYLHSGKGYPVVILTGLGRTYSDFEGLTPILNQAGYETITMDASTLYVANRERSVDGIAALLAELVENTLKDRPYCLIGHDFGSDVIRQFVPKQTNSQIDAAIFVAPTGKSIDEYYLKKRELLYNHLQPPHRRLNAMKELYFYKDNVVPEDWKMDWRGLKASNEIWAFNNLERETWTDDTQIPVLMLHGQNDPIHSAHDALKSMRDQNILDIDVKIVPKTSRAFIPEQPTLLASETIGFLNKYCRS